MAIDTNFKAPPIKTELSPAEQKLDKKLHEVAQIYERQFLGEMLKAMRGTVQETGLIPVSQGERIFKSELDNEYTDKWAKNGGIGLSDLIYQQLREKMIRQPK